VEEDAGVAGSLLLSSYGHEENAVFTRTLKRKENGVQPIPYRWIANMHGI
jgi:hypothetical protein